VRASIEAPGANPWTFLRAFEGAARGFWAQDTGWIAHGGLLHEIDVPWEGPAPDAPRLDPTLDTERFERVRAQAHAGSEVPPERVRWFGGFSFGEGHEPASLWRDFPPALFQRPEFELESDGRVIRLTGWQVCGDGQSRDAAEAALLERLGDIARRARMEAVGGGPAQVRVREPDAAERERWRTMVDRALARLGEGGLAKVVLARSLDVEVEGAVDPVAVVRRLHEQNPRARIFLFEPCPGSAFMGASPETVARRVRGMLDATAVAGSMRRGSGPEEDRALANELLSSEKDLREQEFVVDDMVERLQRWGGRVETDPRPTVLSLSRIHHLETRIRTEVDERTGVLEILADLHPTPAVCGRATDEAFRFLVREEDFDRGWYGGPVGWFDAAGNGMFVPALRCALLHGGAWRLFAGAGIVPGSDPDREWEETQLKLQTALGALANGAR